ncbi:hypothetical protein BPP43_05485 [Brachyspira pilosicoli P43/6/78]|uniref:Lipoprotein n=1 Tax=Brachyspira pilosicoli P43/6/78 TaxID=1042417 RepID=A0A3B6VZB7_BRAPL|nr:hypothetical protein [Brachyspira pilosicoli]AGA66347.1 hypothetical protein BPP43_05485 [Brachyspira pilosicoli P43/6/78]
MSNLIKSLTLITVLILASSCNNSYKPNNSANNNTNNNNTNNNNPTTKTMHLKVRVKGESNNKAFLKYDNMYAKDIDFSINNKTYSYTADFNNGYYLCVDKAGVLRGNYIDTQKYIFDNKIEFDYNSKDTQKTLNGYIWIGYDSHLFFRNNITIKIPLSSFDETKHTNTALITIAPYPDNSSYTYTFDGFESINNY